MLHQFLRFMSNQGLHHNSVHKHYKNLRKFVRLAIQQGYLKGQVNPFDQVKFSAIKTERIYLTEGELEKFEAYKPPADKPLWHLAHQLFLFCCYTGLRYCDVERLTDENFQETADGFDLHFSAKKTGKPYRVNINLLFPDIDAVDSRPVQIIRSRLSELSPGSNARIFPFNHRNSYVRILKRLTNEIDVRQGLKVKISSHVGRHTFGTQLARRLDVEVLQELMQHSSIKETMIYVHLSKRRVHEALEKMVVYLM